MNEGDMYVCKQCNRISFLSTNLKVYRLERRIKDINHSKIHNAGYRNTILEKYIKIKYVFK